MQLSVIGVDAGDGLEAVGLTKGVVIGVVQLDMALDLYVHQIVGTGALNRWRDNRNSGT